MKVTPTILPEVLLLEPKVFGDERGFFMERYNKRTFADTTALDVEFVQDNHSRSAKNVLRGLHYQIRQAQGKLVWAISGTIFDVAVDLRRGSPRFGRSVGLELSAASRNMLWIPPGFAHGFLVTSDAAEVIYKTTDYYAPEHERVLLWNDPSLEIAWPLQSGAEPVLAARDRAGKSLGTVELFD